MHSLLPQPPPTMLPEDGPAEAARADSSVSAEDLAARFPSFSTAWADLAERALTAGQPVAAYAYARTGYHRGLDQLRRNGWKGSGPVPWVHAPNQGFLRCLHALATAAAQIGEVDEAHRCEEFLRDCDPAAAAAIT